MTTSKYSFDVNAENFEQIVIKKSQEVPVLVDIWAPWCGPCKVLKPLLEKFAEEYQGKFILAKLNSDENQALAQQFGVRGIPTVKVIYQGKLVNEFSGALPESQLREFIDGIIPSPAEDLRLKAGELAEQGDETEALSLLDQAIELDGDNAQAITDKAAILIKQKHFDDAKKLIDTLPLQFASTDRVKEMLTHIDVQQNTEGLADAATLEQQVQSDPNNLQARLDLANLYIAQQAYPEAIEQCFEIIRQDRGFQDDIGRKRVLDIFTLLGSNHELVKKSRRRLASLLN